MAIPRTRAQKAATALPGSGSLACQLQLCFKWLPVSSSGRSRLRGGALGAEGVGWGEGAGRSVGAGKRGPASRARAPAPDRARARARPCAARSACGGRVLPGGGVS